MTKIGRPQSGSRMMERHLKCTNSATPLKCKNASKCDGEELHSVRMAATQEAPVTASPLGKLLILPPWNLPRYLRNKMLLRKSSRKMLLLTPNSAGHGSISVKNPDITFSQVTRPREPVQIPNVFLSTQVKRQRSRIHICETPNSRDSQDITW